MFDRFGQPLTPVTGAAKAVDANVNIVPVGLVQRRRSFEVGLMAVDPPRQQPLLDQLAKQVGVGAFPGTHHRTPYRHSVTFQVPQNIVDNLLDGAPCHLASTLRAVGLAHARPQEAKVVLNLSDRGHGGTGVV